MSARLIAVNVVHEVIRGPTRWTAIDKRPVTGLVAVGELGLAGDKIGGVLVEVRSPRDPCGNLSARMGIPKFHRRFWAAGRVGAYLKVLSTGSVQAGNRIIVVCRPDDGMTIGQLVRR
jgi:MOSC domain-containing protein YiiM